MEGFTFAVLSRGFRPTFADFHLDFGNWHEVLCNPNRLNNLSAYNTEAKLDYGILIKISQLCKQNLQNSDRKQPSNSDPLKLSIYSWMLHIYTLDISYWSCKMCMNIYVHFRGGFRDSLFWRLFRGAFAKLSRVWFWLTRNIKILTFI